MIKRNSSADNSNLIFLLLIIKSKTFETACVYFDVTWMLKNIDKFLSKGEQFFSKFVAFSCCWLPPNSISLSLISVKTKISTGNTFWRSCIIKKYFLISSFQLHVAHELGWLFARDIYLYMLQKRYILFLLSAGGDV